MDLLDSILNSMDKPPTASEAQKKMIKKQKEHLEKKQKEEKNMLNKFRKSIEQKINDFVQDNTKVSLAFEPLDKICRAIIHDVAEIAGVQVFSFGEDGIDRYSVVYRREAGPSEDEITVRKAGGVWTKEKAADMKKQRLDLKLQEQAELDSEKGHGRKRKEAEYSGTHYKQKYAHLIGEDSALEAAHKTNTNKNYGEVPSENKKDQRSIEQTMADIKEKKRRKLETEEVASMIPPTE